MKPTEILEKEHRIIEQALARLGKMADLTAAIISREPAVAFDPMRLPR